MVDKGALNKETLQWIQEKLEKNKFPCAKCKHFESVHVKGLCIGCYDEEDDDIHVRSNKTSCYHVYAKMDNLSLIEWVAAYKEEEVKNKLK